MAGYDASRWNALTWGIATDGPIPCLGADRCRHASACRRSTTHRPADILGQACPIESEFYRSAVITLTRQWSSLEDFTDESVPHLAQRTASLMLRRMRAITRLNHAWDLMTDDSGDLAMARHELDLAARYLSAISNEYDTILAKIDAAIEKRDYRLWLRDQMIHGMVEWTDEGPVPVRLYEAPRGR